MASKRKGEAERASRPGQAEVKPRGDFERQAGPEATNRDHPDAMGGMTSVPGAGIVSTGQSDAGGKGTGQPARRASGAGDVPGVVAASDSAGDAARETSDPNYSAATVKRSISSRDAGTSRMDTGGRADQAVATHARNPRVVRDVMTADVEVCNPETELYYVARMMMERDCGAIPVVESTDSMRVVGVITDRDIVVRSIAKNSNPLTQRARDCMSTELVTVSPDESVAECVRMMERRQLRRMLVIDNTGRLCGIVAQADLATTADNHLAAELVREVSESMQDQVPPT